VKWVASGQDQLVAFLQKHLEGRSGKSLRKLLEANLCRVNGRVERFASRKITVGDLIELGSLEAREKQLKIQTIYEDEACTIIDKPAGWVSQNLPGLELVHRLDKETSGLLIFSKTKEAQEVLLNLFAMRNIEKRYLALVDGQVADETGQRVSRLAKKHSYQGQTIWGSAHRGSLAITDWKKIAVNDSSSLLLLEPKTGRTHQIRVHMAEMGHPILVDRQYARSFKCPLFIQRPLLHAYQLRFSLFNRTIDVTASVPDDFRQAGGPLLAHLDC
jgi:23S rRNA-/tRNA-specific pseudouridylate synthase